MQLKADWFVCTEPSEASETSLAAEMFSQDDVLPEEPEDFPEDTTAIQNGEEDEGDTEAELSETIPPSVFKRIETFKAVCWACLIQGFLWVWCSYILAWFGREQIAETLSQVALKEIIAVAFVYAAKACIENLSKHNSWPDKSNKERK